MAIYGHLSLHMATYNNNCLCRSHFGNPFRFSENPFRVSGNPTWVSGTSSPHLRHPDSSNENSLSCCVNYKTIGKKTNRTKNGGGGGGGEAVMSWHPYHTKDLSWICKIIIGKTRGRVKWSAEGRDFLLRGVLRLSHCWGWSRPREKLFNDTSVGPIYEMKDFEGVYVVWS